MVQVIHASNLELYEVEDRFNLRQIRDPQFFLEWQEHLPDVSDFDKQILDTVKENFLSIVRHPLSEEIIKITVLGQLLSLARLTRHPFLPETERSVEISFTEGEEVIRGRIDVLVLHRQLWAVVVEAKRHSLNVTEGLAQALFHMMSSSNGTKPTFALLLNGTEFLFVKLVQHDPSQYSLSRLFSLINPGNDLYTVLGILKQLWDSILNSSTEAA